MTWQQADLTTNGIKLHYYRSEGDKRPVVLLHGATDNGLCWPLVADALVSDYDVITADARGHGQSDIPESGYSRQDHAGDVAGLIQFLRLDQPVVIGHSMGANAAATLGAQHPELVGAVVLEDPPWLDADPDFSAQEFAARSRASILERQALSPTEMLKLGKEENPAWVDAEFAPWCVAKFQVSPHISSSITEANFSWRGVADQITVPTLLIRADNKLGAMVSAETALDIARANEHFTVAHIPNAGHNIRREQFDAYMDELSTFLAKVYPA